jgi:hypothetical protein
VKKAHELVDVGVAGVQPELVEGVRRGLLRVEPDGAGFGLAELGAVGLGDQRQGQAEDVFLVQAARQVGAGDDVAPLVGAADLQHAAVALVEFGEVVALQEAVGETRCRKCPGLRAAGAAARIPS